jgi:N-acyl-L-homoserine lactone synthetase
MLEIVQAGQAGKMNLLLDMHRLRKRVFKDKLGWNVTIQDEDLEVDQFDLP